MVVQQVNIFFLKQFGFNKMFIYKEVTQNKKDITCEKSADCNIMYVIKYFQPKNIQQELKKTSLALSSRVEYVPHSTTLRFTL